MYHSFLLAFGVGRAKLCEDVSSGLFDSQAAAEEVLTGQGMFLVVVGGVRMRNDEMPTGVHGGLRGEIMEAAAIRSAWDFQGPLACLCLV